MGLPQGLSFTGNAINVSSGVIAFSQGGLGFDASGALVTSASAPAFFPNGNPATSPGAVCTIDKSAAVAPLNYQNSLQYDANGRLVTVAPGSAVAPISSSNGLNFDATGALITSVSASGDPNFASVSLLLHMDGTNGSTTFTDSSSNAFGIAAVAPAQISTAQSKFGGASGTLDGVSAGINGPAGNAKFDFGSGDFTIEGFIRPAEVARIQFLMTNRNTAGADPGFWFSMTAAGGLTFIALEPAGTIVVNIATAGGLFTANNWYFVQVIRSGSNFNIYVDNASVGSASYAGAIAASSFTIRLGYDPSAAGRFYNGFLDEWRVTKGVARGTSIPTSAFPNST